MRKDYKNYKSYSKKEVKDEDVRIDDVPVVEAGQEEELDNTIVVKEVKKESRIGKVVNCEMVNVRSKPSFDAPIATIINRDEEVTINEENSTDNFYSVVTSYKIDGFISKDFIELI